MPNSGSMTCAGEERDRQAADRVVRRDQVRADASGGTSWPPSTMPKTPADCGATGVGDGSTVKSFAERREKARRHPAVEVPDHPVVAEDGHLMGREEHGEELAHRLRRVAARRGHPRRRRRAVMAVGDVERRQRIDGAGQRARSSPSSVTGHIWWRTPSRPGDVDLGLRPSAPRRGSRRSPAPPGRPSSPARSRRSPPRSGGRGRPPSPAWSVRACGCDWCGSRRPRRPRRGRSGRGPRGSGGRRSRRGAASRTRTPSSTMRSRFSAAFAYTAPDIGIDVGGEVDLGLRDVEEAPRLAGRADPRLGARQHVVGRREDLLRPAGRGAKGAERTNQAQGKSPGVSGAGRRFLVGRRQRFNKACAPVI